MLYRNSDEYTISATIEALKTFSLRTTLRHQELGAQFDRLDAEHPEHDTDYDSACDQCEAIYALIGKRHALGRLINKADTLAEDLKAYLPETTAC